MRIKVSSVVDESVAKLLREALPPLEDRLNEWFAGKAFGAGVDQFSIFVISLDSNGELNHRFALVHEKGGRYKEPFSEASIRYISMAVPLNCEEVISLDVKAIQREVCGAVERRFSDKTVKVPRGFHVDDFMRNWKAAVWDCL